MNKSLKESNNRYFAECSQLKNIIIQLKKELFEKRFINNKSNLDLTNHTNYIDLCNQT